MLLILLVKLLFLRYKFYSFFFVICFVFIYFFILFFCWVGPFFVSLPHSSLLLFFSCFLLFLPKNKVYLPTKQKTILPKIIGGRAGGDKYIVHNILFKFAVDSFGLFGGSTWAASKV